MVVGAGWIINLAVGEWVIRKQRARRSIEDELFHLCISYWVYRIIPINRLAQIKRIQKSKAIVCTNYGTPDVLQIKEVDMPIPQTNEVLVKVQCNNSPYWGYANA